MWTYPLPQNISFKSTALYYCNRCNGIVSKEDVPNHEEFHANYVRKEDSMSSVKWCDPGNHAFKAGVPGSQSFRGTTTDENGLPVTMEMDACPNHAFNSPGVKANAITDKHNAYGDE